MFYFLNKYIKNLKLEVRFIPLNAEQLQVELFDHYNNLKGTTIIPLRLLLLGEQPEINVIEEYLNPILLELGDKKAEIYANRYNNYKRNELEKFWKD